MKFNIDRDDYLIDKYCSHNNLYKYNTSFFYGEVDMNDLYQIINEHIVSSDNELDDNNIYLHNLHFLDIGSGCGKIIYHINKKTNMNCTGIEIIEHRYLKSKELINEDNYNVEFIHDNFKNIYLGNYDIIYCCNIIFSDEDNDLLYLKLNKEFTGYALLFTYNNKIHDKLISTHQVNTSWQKNVFIYLFYF